jgi:CubicO group peptidase (beta-lactamase class C family)
MKKITSILISSLLLLASCEDSSSYSIHTEEELTNSLQNIAEASSIPGFTIGIIKNGTICYQNSFGYRNIEFSQPYTNTTIQPIGSISKTFLAIATVKCISNGYFDLDTPINDLLPQPIINPLYTNEPIKIKHLVQHSSGLVDNPNSILSTYYFLPNQNLTTEGAQLLINAGFTNRSPRTLQELIEDYYYPTGNLYDTNNFLSVAPGTNYSYSNIASSLMAYIIEVSTNMSYDEFVNTAILSPLQMENTNFYYDFINTNNVYANLYFENNIPFPFYNCDSYPDGFLKTNNVDLTKFLQDMIRGNMGVSEVLFPNNYYQMLFSETGFNHSIFWLLEGNSIHHSGGDPGISCNLAFNKVKNQGYFVLTNYDVSTPSHIGEFENFIQRIENNINQFLDSQSN